MRGIGNKVQSRTGSEDREQVKGGSGRVEGSMVPKFQRGDEKNGLGRECLP